MVAKGSPPVPPAQDECSAAFEAWLTATYPALTDPDDTSAGLRALYFVAFWAGWKMALERKPPG